MQHHDAMTGTHMLAVGIDYLKMMKTDKLIQFDPSGRLGHELKSNAKAQGIDLHDVLQCKVEGYHTLDCIKDIEPG